MEASGPAPKPAATDGGLVITVDPVVTTPFPAPTVEPLPASAPAPVAAHIPPPVAVAVTVDAVPAPAPIVEPVIVVAAPQIPAGGSPAINPHDYVAGPSRIALALSQRQR